MLNPTRPTSRRATPASTARTTAIRSNGGPRVKPRFLDLDTGEITGGIYSWYDGKSDKTAFSRQGLATSPTTSWARSHDFKFGVQYNSGGGDYVIGPNDYIYTYGSEPCLRLHAAALPRRAAGCGRSGVFVDDTYPHRLRLTLNVGAALRLQQGLLRLVPDILDAQRQRDRRAVTGRGQALPLERDLAAPRLQLEADRRRHDGAEGALRPLLPRHRDGRVRQHRARRSRPRYLFSGHLRRGGATRRASSSSPTTRNLRVDPDFKNPYTDQFIVGLEQQVGEERRLLGQLRLQARRATRRLPGHRRHLRSSCRATDASGRERPQVLPADERRRPRLFQLTNPDRMFSRYNGVTFEVNKRMSNHWQANVGLHVLEVRRAGSDRARPAPRRSTPDQHRRHLRPEPERLHQHRRAAHRGPAGDLQDAARLPAALGHDASFNFPTRAAGRHRASAPPEQPHRHPRHESRRRRRRRRAALSSWTTLDVRLEKAFRFGGTAELAVFGDFLNLFNNDANESVVDRRRNDRTTSVPTRFVLPRRLMLARSSASSRGAGSTNLGPGTRRPGASWKGPGSRLCAEVRSASPVRRASSSPRPRRCTGEVSRRPIVA